MGGESDWPIEFQGVTESLVATLGPNDRWNLAPLGLHPPGGGAGSSPAADADEVTARTWEETRTRRNFRVEGGGHVLFVRDPVTFVEAALSIVERDEPILPAADAWARVEVERLESGSDGEATWADWALEPVESAVHRRAVPTTNRGYAAVVEASVAASRLDVAAYDSGELRERIDYFESVVERCGRERDRTAFDRIRTAIDR